MKKNKIKTTKYDFKCDCGCGQRLRIIRMTWKDKCIFDIGIMRLKEKRPKVGVVLRSDGNLKKFLKIKI